MFLHGFSGGSQFVHRFTMLHPKLVCGVSSHSGGTWATDNHGRISSAAKKIPFAISCGEKDTQLSFAESPYNRIQWYERFRTRIDQEGFCYIGKTWPDVGHSISPGAWDLAKQCFQLATGLPGESATKPVVISDAWKNLELILLKAKARTWTNTKGRTIEADILRVEGNAAIVKRNGKEVRLPLEMLGEQDKQFVAKWNEENNATKKPAPPAPAVKKEAPPASSAATGPGEYYSAGNTPIFNPFPNVTDKRPWLVRNLGPLGIGIHLIRPGMTMEINNVEKGSCAPATRVC